MIVILRRFNSVLFRWLFRVLHSDASFYEGSLLILNKRNTWPYSHGDSQILLIFTIM